MNKQELGAFLRSRRERLRPEDAGLPSGPRRRTPGLRREEVAVLAHISTEYYVRLEQGRAPRPSGEVLAGIAGALRLTDAETGHLHVLAGTAPARYGISDAAEFRQHVVMELRATLARYPSDPAVTGLVEELRDGSPEFAGLWERHDVQAAPMLTKTFRHPAVGEITVDCDSLTLSDRDQHLVLYTAPPGSRDAEVLALLQVIGTESISASGTPGSG
jgi:transcriptional regulator with XRE-family HTH domain